MCQENYRGYRVKGNKMKRIHEYENETLETYYALGKGNKFYEEFDFNGKVIFCKEPKDAHTFKNYERAKNFLTEYSKRLEGFKIYAINHWVRTETFYTVYDCDVYKENQKGIRVNGVIQTTGKFDKDCNRIGLKDV